MLKIGRENRSPPQPECRVRQAPPQPAPRATDKMPRCEYHRATRPPDAQRRGRFSRLRAHLAPRGEDSRAQRLRFRVRKRLPQHDRCLSLLPRSAPAGQPASASAIAGLAVIGRRFMRPARPGQGCSWAGTGARDTGVLDPAAPVHRPSRTMDRQSASRRVPPPLRRGRPSHLVRACGEISIPEDAKI